MWHLLRSVLAALGLWLLMFSALAQPRVVIVSSDSTTAYIDAVKSVLQELQRGGVPAHDATHLSLAQWSAQPVTAQSTRLYVALGTQATATLADSRLPAPVLAALIPLGSFERVLASNGRKGSSELAAIYLDQPLARQLAMIRLALPQTKRLGVLWGPNSWPKAPALRALAQANGWSVREAGPQEQHNVFPDLQQVLNDSDVFLALADPQVFNSNTIQNILLATLRSQVPVVAFSPAYVRAGALLSLHASPEQVGRQAGGLALEALRGVALPSHPIESNDFEVSVNEHVARALSLTLDAQALRQALRRWERLP